MAGCKRSLPPVPGTDSSIAPAPAVRGDAGASPRLPSRLPRFTRERAPQDSEQTPEAVLTFRRFLAACACREKKHGFDLTNTECNSLFQICVGPPGRAGFCSRHSHESSRKYLCAQELVGVVRVLSPAFGGGGVLNKKMCAKGLALCLAHSEAGANQRDYQHPPFPRHQPFLHVAW